MKQEGNKQALLVGINDYGGVADLRGCLNDVTNMRNILKHLYGFSNDQTRVLTDQRATRDNILLRLDKMVKTARYGDLLVFHFSGHGSQIRDRDDDELRDHMDELICPYDMDWDGVFITDDMLGEILDELPEGVTMEVILDCCHSGTGTRYDQLGRPEELGPLYPVINRYLSPPLDIACRFEDEAHWFETKRAFREDQRIVRNHVLWAGCKDHQTSADAYIDGSYNGAFTYYFCKHIRKCDMGRTRKELHERVVHSLKHHQFFQTPQLECTQNRQNRPFLSHAFMNKQQADKT